MIVELFFLIIFLIISIAYSLVYAVILNYIFKITFKKINKTKPFILNYFFLFCGILFIIIFLKFNRNTSYSDFHNRYIPVAKNYRIENNEVNMTYFYPNLEKQNFNNNDEIFLEKIGFNKDYIYGKLPQKNDSINFQNYEKTYALNSKYVVFNLNNSEMKLFKDSIQFNSFAKQNNLKNSNGLKTFEDIYSEIIKKNRWKKYFFLQY